jgi:hypothetical protein
MANPKDKTNKKSSSSNSKVTMKTVPNPRNFKPGKTYGKTVTKKDGKTTVSYQRLNTSSGMINRPSTVTKEYDSKGNLLKGTERIEGGYGAHTDIDLAKKRTVVNAKGKTVYDPKARTITTYDKKGKTIVDKKNNKTTTLNKKGKTIVDEEGKEVVNEKGSRFVSNDRSLGKQVTVRDKKGTRFYHDGELSTNTTKEGKKYYFDDGKVLLYNSKGTKDVTPKKEKTPVKTSEKKVTPPISKAPVNKTPVKKDTTPKKESFNLDAEVKKTMSGAYGSGSARKEALGSNYSKVQAEINKRAAASKPKASAPKTVAKPEIIKMEIKKPGKIESNISRELQGVPKPTVDVDKSVDAAMEAIGKSKIMRKGGSIKSKTMNKMKTYKTGGMVNPNANLQAGKKAGSKGVKSGMNPKAKASNVAKGKSGGTNKSVPRPKKG